MAISLFDKITNKALSKVPDLFTLLSSEIQIRDGQLGFQIAKGLKILDLDVMEPSRLMQQPREDGSFQADFQVQDPTQITINGIFDSDDYASNMEELRIMQRTSTKLTVQGRGNSFFDMYIETLPSKANARNFSTLTVTIGLKEALIFGTSDGGFSLDDLADPLNSDIVQNGLKTARTSIESIQSQATDAITGFF